MKASRKTKRSHPFRVVSPSSFKSNRVIGKFESREAAQAHIDKVQKHMPENPLVIEVV